MENILDVHERSYDENCPVICMDEKSYQLLDHARQTIPMKPGQITLEENEYIRNGTCSIFIFTEPLKGWRRVDVLQRRIKIDWAEQVRIFLKKIIPV